MNIITGQSGANYFLDRFGGLFRPSADCTSIDKVTDPGAMRDASEGTLLDLSDGQRNTPSGDDSIGPPAAKTCYGRTEEDEFDFAPTRRSNRSAQPAPSPEAVPLPATPLQAAVAPVPWQAASVAPAEPVADVRKSAQPDGDAGFSDKAQTERYTEQQSTAFGNKLVGHLQKELGITENQAKGIVANLTHESAGLNPGMNQGMKIGDPSANMADDNANGFGLAQWGGVRKEALIKLAGDQNIPASSEKANVDYLVKELKEPGALDDLKRTSSTEDATVSFCNTFERPSDPQMASRLEYARKLA
ncbi:MAG: phage tail tip lysozyme [Pseudomonadota bacterium]